MKKETIEIITLIVSSGGILFSAVAAIAAWRSASISSKQLKEQRDENERLEKPRLVPLNTLVNPHVNSILSDWKLPKTANGMVEQIDGVSINSDFSPLPNRFSDVKIPMINAGKSFAIDVTYSLTLVGGISSIDDYESDFAKIQLDSKHVRELDSEIFNILVIDYNHDEVRGVSNDIFTILPHSRHISIIESGDKDEIFIPSYFVALSNIYFKEHYTRFFTERKTSKMKKPSIKLVINYVDQYYKKHHDEYFMEISTKQFDSPSYIPRFEAWIDFIYIDPIKTKKQK